MSNAVDAINIIAAAIPAFDGDEMSHKKALYLSYRISNFTSRESEKLANVSHKQVTRWRQSDPQFLELDGTGLTNLRKTMSNEFLDMQFTRNFRLIMEKDFQVLYKDATNEPLTLSEMNYLAKIRQHYTPQSLAVVKQLLSGGTVDAPFDFTKLTLEVRREQITIVQEQHGQRS
ncbi:MAG: hypothetical protein WC364_05745 [Eubacteriales bacterium]|jgi:hypothetical protein